MRAIISDVHANLEALQAVLRDIEQQGADEIYCLGNIIGFGPNPRECIDLVMERCRVVLLGDRDHATLYDEGGDFGTEGYQSAVWTRNEMESPLLPEEERRRRWEFLAACPSGHREGDFLYVQGHPLNPRNEPDFPEAIYDLRKLERNFDLVSHCCFVGYTRIPGILTQNRRFLSPEDVDFTYPLSAQKVICAVGAVGLPGGDENWRASYALLDGKIVRFRRLEYDIDTTIQKLEAIPDLPNSLQQYLQEQLCGPALTEKQWRTLSNPHPMVDFVRGRATERKMSLFACACCRRIWPFLKDTRSQNALKTLERYLDGVASENELREARIAAHQAKRFAEDNWASDAAAAVASACASTLVIRAVMMAVASTMCHYPGRSAGQVGSRETAEYYAQADLLRHIVGNPFRPCAAPASWPAAVVQLAEAQNAGADCAFALHDALLEGGQPDLAAHFREPRHPKGCWVVDLILGKS